MPGRSGPGAEAMRSPSFLRPVTPTMPKNGLSRPVSLTSVWAQKWTPERISPPVLLLQDRSPPSRSPNSRSLCGSNESLTDIGRRAKVSIRRPRADQRLAAADRVARRRAVKSLVELREWDENGQLIDTPPADTPRRPASDSGGSSWNDDPVDITIATGSKVSPTLSSSSFSQINCGSADKNKSSNDAWGRFTRLLNNQRDRTPPEKNGQYRRRTYSLESNDEGRLRKASSIDCLVDPSPNSLVPSIGLTESKSIQLGPGGSTHLLEAPFVDIPLSPSMPSKLGKRSGWRHNSMELLTVDSLAMTKAERKKLEKLNKVNIHLQALFGAVEHQQVEKARNILDNTDVDVNGLNNDGLNPLDISVMSHNIPLVKLLQSHGARENGNYLSKESRSSHLTSLVNEAEKKVEDLTSYVLNVATSGNISATQIKETEKQLSLWERRHRLLKRLRVGFDQSKCPESPSLVTISVISTNSLRVVFAEPHNQSMGITTKYKVQWSRYDDFTPLEGEEELYDLRCTYYVISDLEQGTRYYVRVACGNMKGYGPYRLASPSSVVPSIWRDVDRRSPRCAGRLSVLDDLFNQIRNSRPEYASEIKGITDQLDTPVQQRKNQMRKSIKSLFTPAPKFHKHLKRGIFLACLLFNDDRVLVTTEENLPVIEVDETYPSSFYTDFHWMMKVACTWDDVKSLRQDMEKSLSSSTVYFRSKLLQASAQMQNAMGIQDLGQFFYRPLKDSNGTMVICTVNHIRDIKQVNAISMKWVPRTKIQRRVPFTTEHLHNAGEMLLAAISEQISYHQVSKVPMSRGLYLGYLKLKSSMDLIRILVPEQTPNVLPHCLIRENPHVSCEEWEWVKTLARDDSKVQPSALQLQFSKQLTKATRKLFNHLGVMPDEAVNHRIYDVEVIELSSDVSFILVLPSIENVCSVPGQREQLTARMDVLALPVQVFEMVHMTTYQRDFISRYSRLSSILEMDTIMAQHAHREAFSSSEVAAARQRLSQLQEFQIQVDSTWKGMRWIMDVLTWARDKQSAGGLLMSVLHDWLHRELLTIRDSDNMDNSEKSEIHDDTHTMSGVDLIDDSQPGLHEHHPNNLLSVGSSKGSSSFPKSYSDSFANFGSDIGPSMEDSESSVYDDALSLTTSLKSLSSNDLPNDDVCDTNSDTASLENKVDAIEGQVTKLTNTAEDSVNPGSPTSKNGEEESTKCRIEPGILRVYAAYNTGLASGTSVKLHVTPRTTAREVIDLVVKQLNMAVVMKGKSAPIYSVDQLHDFCLVAVLGARERCLRDDFRPLQLQNPWTKGRLYVRMKTELLAAIQQHSIHQSAYL